MRKFKGNECNSIKLKNVLENESKPHAFTSLREFL